MNKKSFWVIFLKDPVTKVTHGSAHAHNATGDYKHHPFYIGTKRIEVDMDELDGSDR